MKEWNKNENEKENENKMKWRMKRIMKREKDYWQLMLNSTLEVQLAESFALGAAITTQN